MLAAVNYHYIREDFTAPFPSIFGKTPQQFEEQIMVLSGMGEFVSAKQIHEAILHEKTLPDRAIIITFDDGLFEQYSNALPILDKYKIPAIFFVNTSNLTDTRVQNVHKIHMLRAQLSPEDITSDLKNLYAGRLQTIDQDMLVQNAVAHYKYDTAEAAALKYLMNFILSEDEVNNWTQAAFIKFFGDDEDMIHRALYMTQEQIKDLYKRDMLGSHGHTHIPVGQFKEEIRQKEAKLSQQIIKELTGGNIAAFSFPYGSLSSVTGMNTILKESGYTFAFSMERAINHNLDSPFALSRLDNNDLPLGKAYRFEDNDFYKHYPERSWNTK